MRVFLLCLLIPGNAFAHCDAGMELYFSCTFESGRKEVRICHNTKDATYAFGPSGGTPELQLRRLVTELDYKPWPGAGLTVWEELTFHNEEFSYLIAPFIERQFPENENDDIIVTTGGSIFFAHDGEEIGLLKCDEGSVDFPWGNGIFEAKEAAGQCYEDFEWVECR